MDPEEPNWDQDEWLLKPRASDEMELTANSFKAFGRLLILKFKLGANNEENSSQNADDVCSKP